MSKHTPRTIVVRSAYASFRQDSIEHGTLNGEITLCGRRVRLLRREGSVFGRWGLTWSCKRCLSIVAKAEQDS